MARDRRIIKVVKGRAYVYLVREEYLGPVEKVGTPREYEIAIRKLWEKKNERKMEEGESMPRLLDDVGDNR